MDRIEQTISSVEVAEMVGKAHNKLMRDIREYIDQLAQSNLGHDEFFNESTYVDNNNRTRPCYQITKKGCEFIAHKLTGIKGTEFTARYINRFHDMEKQIVSPLEGLSTELQAVIVVDKRVTKIENRIDRLEYDIPLYGAEADELCNHVKHKGVEMMGGKESNAYKDTKVRAAVYTDIYNQIKREFGLYDEKGRFKTYKALKRRYINEAHELIDSYELPTYLQEQVKSCNAQVSMEVA